MVLSGTRLCGSEGLKEASDRIIVSGTCYISEEIVEEGELSLYRR